MTSGKDGCEREWAYSLDREYWVLGYKDKYAAIRDATDDAKLDGDDVVYVGEVNLFEPKIDGAEVIAYLFGCVDGSIDFDPEIADGWLECVDPNEVNRLGDMMTATLSQWLKETGNMPDFGSVDDYEEVEVD